MFLGASVFGLVNARFSTLRVRLLLRSNATSGVCAVPRRAAAVPFITDSEPRLVDFQMRSGTGYSGDVPERMLDSTA